MKISNTGTLLLLGLGAWAIYKYNNMNEDEQTAIKDKSKKLFDEHIGPFISNALSLGNEGKEKLQEIFAR